MIAPVPRLHLVTDDRILAWDDFGPLAQRLAVRGGSRLALHVRGPGTRAADLFARAREVIHAARESGTLVVANDRVDLALALDLGGVQLGARSLPPATVRELVGSGRLMGVSVHGPEAAIEAAGGGADYLVVGTIFRTASHPGRAPAGPERIVGVAGAVSRPLIGIGGITPERVSAVIEAGAHGVAVVGGIWDADDPPAALKRYLDALPAGPAGPGTAGGFEHLTGRRAE